MNYHTRSLVPCAYIDFFFTAPRDGPHASKSPRRGPILKLPSPPLRVHSILVHIIYRQNILRVFLSTSYRPLRPDPMALILTDIFVSTQLYRYCTSVRFAAVCGHLNLNGTLAVIFNNFKNKFNSVRSRSTPIPIWLHIYK